MAENKKSDVAAKQAFIRQLETRGFTAEIAAAPADIIAVKDGETYYFEIKMTKTAGKKAYFGAATLTEWRQALQTPERFRFVIAYADETGREFTFREYTPEEFLQFSTIPPFKIFFSIPPEAAAGTCPAKPRHPKSAVAASVENLTELDICYQQLRDRNNGRPEGRGEANRQPAK